MENKRASDKACSSEGSAKRARTEGRKRALLVGINYFGTKLKLGGCINDTRSMSSLLTNTFGWPHDCIKVLSDDNEEARPTRANITQHLRWLVEGAQSGDALFFHYSGHGGQQVDPLGIEEDGMNETICPVDFRKAGMMTDDEMSELIVNKLPDGVRLTVVMDSCHSVSGLDLPFTWNGNAWREVANPCYSAADVQLFSGCEDQQTSADAMQKNRERGGALTNAFCDVLLEGQAPTYAALLAKMQQVLTKRGFSQRPQLTSTQRFEFDRPFLLRDVVPNANSKLGRRPGGQRFPPRPRKPPFYDLLGLATEAIVDALGEEGEAVVNQVTEGVAAFTGQEEYRFGDITKTVVSNALSWLNGT